MLISFGAPPQHCHKWISGALHLRDNSIGGGAAPQRCDNSIWGGAALEHCDQLVLTTAALAAEVHPPQRKLLSRKVATIWLAILLALSTTYAVAATGAETDKAHC